jgi:hypothetical protein
MILRIIEEELIGVFDPRDSSKSIPKTTNEISSTEIDI